MSTVLWANYLSDGVVTSDESDKYALYKYLDKLDDLAAASKMPPLSSLCDSTDIEFNLGDEDELPDGIESTNELMAQKGVWVEAQNAVRLLEVLLTVIQSKKMRFGLLKNDHDDVVSELQESLSFAKKAAEKNARFNFAIIM